MEIFVEIKFDDGQIGYVTQREVLPIDQLKAQDYLEDLDYYQLGHITVLSDKTGRCAVPKSEIFIIPYGEPAYISGMTNKGKEIPLIRLVASRDYNQSPEYLELFKDAD